MDEQNNEQNVSDAINNVKQKISFWQDGISIDESKISILVFCLVVTLIFSVVMYCIRGDISQNLTSIITTLIYAIAGVNITNSGISTITNKIGTFLNPQQNNVNNSQQNNQNNFNQK